MLLALRYILIALLLYAPLLCLRYCETLEQVTRAGDLTTQFVQRDRDYARIANEHAHQGHQHSHGGSGHAPMTRLQEMVSTVTEFVAPINFQFLRVTIAYYQRALLPSMWRVLLDIPTPPPRGKLA